MKCNNCGYNVSDIKDILKMKHERNGLCVSCYQSVSSNNFVNWFKDIIKGDK